MGNRLVRLLISLGIYAQVTKKITCDKRRNVVHVKRASCILQGAIGKLHEF
jgi:hypothetical protein